MKKLLVRNLQMRVSHNQGHYFSGVMVMNPFVVISALARPRRQTREAYFILILLVPTIQGGHRLDQPPDLRPVRPRPQEPEHPAVPHEGHPQHVLGQGAQVRARRLRQGIHHFQPAQTVSEQYLVNGDTFLTIFFNNAMPAFHFHCCRRSIGQLPSCYATRAWYTFVPWRGLYESRSNGWGRQRFEFHTTPGQCITICYTEIA